MNRSIDFSIRDTTGRLFEFKKLSQLHSFLNDESEFWRKKHDSLDNKQNMHPAFKFYSQLDTAITTIDKWSSQLDEWDDNTLRNQLNKLIHNPLRSIDQNWLWSGNSFISTFIVCHKEYGINASTSFIKYIAKKQISNLQDHTTFIGVMMAYEFTNQDSDLLKRRNGEKLSFNQLRDRLEHNTNDLIGKVDEFKSDFSRWDETSRNNWSNWVTKVNEENSLSNKSFKDDFDKFISNSSSGISALEATYEEKLRLSKPAEYWKKSAKKLKEQGDNWSYLLIGSLVLGFLVFSCFFLEWLQGKEIGIQLNSIQGVVIFGTGISTYAFIISTLTKLTFSSFHLMRDAEEREQLTYLYLSLVNEKAIEESSRDIVLQALFSRSETGLLKSESGPTMPLGEVLKTASKAR